MKQYLSIISDDGSAKMKEITHKNYEEIIESIRKSFIVIKQNPEIEEILEKIEEHVDREEEFIQTSGRIKQALMVTEKTLLILKSVEFDKNPDYSEVVSNAVNRAIKICSKNLNKNITTIKDKITVQLGIDTTEYRKMVRDLFITEGEDTKLYDILHNKVGKNTVIDDRKYLEMKFKKFKEMLS